MNNEDIQQDALDPALPKRVGIRNHELFPIWSSMKARCSNPKHRKFHRYGGRGIKVCERWLDFDNFVSDMGPRPEGGTLERRENDKGYEPGNCVWATYTEQNNNRSNVKKFNYNGELVTLSQISKAVGISLHVLRQRIVRRGWDMARAVSVRPEEHHNSKFKRGT